MALAATSFVDQEMTSSLTTPVTRMATKPAWKAGWDQNATKVCDKCSKPEQSMGLGRIWVHHIQLAIQWSVCADNKAKD